MKHFATVLSSYGSLFNWWITLEFQVHQQHWKWHELLGPWLPTFNRLSQLRFRKNVRLVVLRHLDLIVFDLRLIFFVFSSQIISPSWVSLHRSRGIQDPSHKFFMRMTVLLTMWLIYVPVFLFIIFYKSSCKMKVR